jgi:hypothetical protein
MHYPPGTIGILTSELSRWTWFYQSLLALEKPLGSQVVFCSGQWVATAVNRLVDAMRPTDEFLSVWSDDHIFEPDILLRLLAHHLPLVAPLVALRRLPFAPSVFHEQDGEFKSYTWAELRGKRGLLPVDTFGGPGCVIRREVIEAVGTPFFENMPGQRVAPHEDLYAFLKCKQKGFQPMVDLDIHIGHCIPAAVFPGRTDEGQYGVHVWSHGEILGALFPEQAEQDAAAYHAYT